MKRRHAGAESRRRAGRAVRSLIWQERRSYARRNWRLLLALGGLPVLLAGIFLLSFQDTFVRGLIVGLGSAGVVFALWYPFVLNGSHARALGGEAEGYTSEELRKLDRRRWIVIDDVSFERTNIDHVLVGPGRVYAVETKWRSRPVSRQEQQDLAKRAQEGSRRLRLLLKAERSAAAVESLVVIWGPGSHAIEGVEEIDGVRLVAGLDAKRWLPLIDETASGMDINHPVAEAIRRYVMKRDLHLATNG